MSSTLKEKITAQLAHVEQQKQDSLAALREALNASVDTIDSLVRTAIDTGQQSARITGNNCPRVHTALAACHEAFGYDSQPVNEAIRRWLRETPKLEGVSLYLLFLQSREIKLTW